MYLRLALNLHPPASACPVGSQAIATISDFSLCVPLEVFIIYLMHIGVLSAYMYAHQNRALDYMGLQLQIIVSYYMGAGIEPRSSQRTASALPLRIFSPVSRVCSLSLAYL